MGGSSPCASCKLLRRRCAEDCIFAPYFSKDDPLRFSIVHKVFGASNVGKILQRADAASSLVYEANARLEDPVFGSAGVISCLQKQVSQLQMQLAMAQAEILCMQMQQIQGIGPNPHMLTYPDEKSFILSNVDPPHHELFNFVSSSIVIHEPLKNEKIHGHHIVI